MAHQQWDRWKEAEVDRILRTPPGEPVAPLAERLLPPDEEMAPTAPGDLLGRYVVVLARWSALLSRQAAHDLETARLKANAKELKTAWQALGHEYEQCRRALETVEVSLDSVLTVHLAQLGTPSPLSDTPLPRLLQQLLAARRQGTPDQKTP